MKTEYLDLQFQPARIEWLQAEGDWRGYTFDAAYEMENGSLVFDEYKASGSDFSKPLVKAKIDAATHFLKGYGIKVRTRDGSQLQCTTEHAAINELWGVRRTKVVEGDIDRARDILSRSGGELALAQLLENLHPRTDIAFGIASALMMRRIVKIHLDQGLVPDAMVSAPPEATPGNLRRFLARFAEKR